MGFAGWVVLIKAVANLLKASEFCAREGLDAPSGRAEEEFRAGTHSAKRGAARRAASLRQTNLPSFGSTLDSGGIARHCATCCAFWESALQSAVRMNWRSRATSLSSAGRIWGDYPRHPCCLWVTQENASGFGSDPSIAILFRAVWRGMGWCARGASFAQEWPQRGTSISPAV